MRAPTNPVLVNCVGTGVLDRPLTKRNLRTVREADPYEHRVSLCKIKELHKPEFTELLKNLNAEKKSGFSATLSLFIKVGINRNISQEDPGMPCRVLLRLLPSRELCRG